MTNRLFRQVLACGASLVAFAALSQPALAQNANCDDLATQAERDSCAAANGSSGSDEATIVVTGSRIARANFDTIEPAIVIDSKQIEARGFTTLGQALNEQPAFGIPGSSPVGSNQSSFGPGQSFVDFFSLGSQRTLTLVNGRRFVSSNTATIFGPTGSGSQVDLNVIPTKLIDRVETIAVGGAPIYGSDAIAGTINIILKRNYEGVDLDGQYGLSSRGDAADYRLRGLAGMNFADGRGNVTISGEYNKGDGLLFTDRKLTSSGDFFAAPNSPTSPFGLQIFPDRRIPALSEHGIPLVGGEVFGLAFPLSPTQSENLIFGDPTLNFGVDGRGAPGTQLRFDGTGNLIPINFGQFTGTLNDFNIDFAGGNGFSLTPTANLLTKTERYSANLITQYELSDKIRVFGEFFYSSSQGVNLRDQPVYNTQLFGAAGDPDGNIILSVNNPFLTTAARTAIVNAINDNPFSDLNQGVVGSQDYFYLARANTDLQSGLATGRVEVTRYVGGLDGSFNVGDKTWKWEASLNYGRSKAVSRAPAIVQQNFENAVNAVRNAAGSIVCAPGATNAAIATLSSTCAPLNLFGSGNASKAATDYITAIAVSQSTNSQLVGSASIAGPLFELPGGNLSFALGYEHREEKSNFDPGEFFLGRLDPTDPTGQRRLQYGRSIPILPVTGKFDTNEVFGELNAELIGPGQNIPLIRMLEVKGAARYIDHSVAGGDLTWTVGGRWSPIRDITVRGNFTRAVRAPAITESFNPSSQFFGFADDPCDRNNLRNGPNPAKRAANCLAGGAGLPGLPTTFSASSDDRSFSQSIAGNARLANEKANSYTIGAIIAPRFIPRLRVSLDYVDINLKGVISQFTGTQVANACYDSNSFPSEPFCQRITRATTGAATVFGQLTGISSGYFNGDQLRYQGYLAEVDYNFDTPFLGKNSVIRLGLNYQYLDTLTTRASGSSASTQLDGDIGTSHHEGVLSASYENDGFTFFTSAAYLGKAKFDVTEAPGFRTIPGVGDVVFVNMSAAYEIDKKFTIRLVVDNVFDQAPPSPSPTGGGTITYFRGVLGRYFRMGASVKF